jgi:PBSX family phage terminase large subunit
MKTIQLSRWQTIVRRDNHRYKVINCGRRAGKSYLVSIELLRFATEHTNTDSWVITPSYKQSKAIMWEMLKDLVPPEIIKKANESELIIELINNSRIMLKGGDNPDSLRGVKIDFCVFDETAFFNKWKEVWKVIRPTLVDSKAEVWFISTPNGMNHFRDLYLTKSPDWASFHFTSYENPFLDKNELEIMKNEMDEDSFAQEIMGEFRKMSGLIYKEFDRDIHMIDIPTFKFTEDWTFTRSLDFGFAHKSALGYFAISPTKDEMYLFDGLYETRLFESGIAEIVKEKDIGMDIIKPVADSAQPMSIAQLFHEGVRFDPVDKSTDSVKNGIVRVAELLKVRPDTGKPTLMFNKSLTWIADEFETYRWIETKQDGVVKEVPYKVNDDAMDMIRYFAITHTNRSDAEMFITKEEFKGRESFVIGESGTIPAINIKDFVGEPNE